MQIKTLKKISTVINKLYIANIVILVLVCLFSLGLLLINDYNVDNQLITLLTCVFLILTFFLFIFYLIDYFIIERLKKEYQKFC